MICPVVDSKLPSNALPLWTAAVGSISMLILGEFVPMETWKSILFMNAGSVGLISCLGGFEMRRFSDMREIARLHGVVTTDPLTGVGNRRAFEQDLSRQVMHFRRYRTPCSILVIDIDHFKSINDLWGHGVGDQVLKATARTMSATLRDIDLLFRVGGEEFAVLLPATDGPSAVIVAERIRSVVSEMQIPVPNRRIDITVSLGGAQLMDLESEDDWYKRADEALLWAKRSGRNCIIFKNLDDTETASLSKCSIDKTEKIRIENDPHS